MISEVVMPQMGADMVEGTLLRWIKHEGDPVERGEVIAEIETDKANVEIEAFESGVFRKRLAAEGDVVPVGGVIALIAAATDDVSTYAIGTPSVTALAPAAVMAPPASPTPTPVLAPPSRPPGAVPAPPATPSATQADRVRVSPVARRMAEERGIDLHSLSGSGPDGRIIRRDVESAAPGTAGPAAHPVQRSVAPTQDTVVGQSKMRQAIARRMSQSKREAPHYYLLTDIDMTDAAAFRAQLNETLGDAGHVSVNDLLVRAVSLALQRFPYLNATLTDGVIASRAEQNVCIAIALDEGLIAPAIVGAGRMSLPEIAVASQDLVARAKSSHMRPEELNDGTFTITNLGAYGVETLIGIIQPPQTAILGVGSIIDAPAVRDGAIVARKLMKVALSADHRTTDGAYGAQFLAELKRLLEHPLTLIL